MADIALRLSSTRPNLTTLRRLEVSSSEEHKLTVSRPPQNYGGYPPPQGDYGYQPPPPTQPYGYSHVSFRSSIMYSEC
jgi:hypothetical protein